MTSLPANILREYDIRGTVGKNLDEGIAHQVGQRFALSAMAVEKAGAIVVCRDGRLSSVWPCHSASSGLGSWSHLRRSPDRAPRKPAQSG